MVGVEEPSPKSGLQKKPSVAYQNPLRKASPLKNKKGRL
jgi:hypothetical protein